MRKIIQPKLNKINKYSILKINKFQFFFNKSTYLIIQLIQLEKSSRVSLPRLLLIMSNTFQLSNMPS